MMDINTLPRLEKSIRFDDRFNTDWRFSQVRKVFFAMGYPPFFEFLCAWVSLILNKQFVADHGENGQGNHKEFKKILLLKPRHNDNAIIYCTDAFSLMKGLNQYWNLSDTDWSELKKQASPDLLLPLNESDNAQVLLSAEDVEVIKQVLRDLTDFFFMLQWVEISQFAPEHLPKPQVIYRGGKPTYQWGF